MDRQIETKKRQCNIDSFIARILICMQKFQELGSEKFRKNNLMKTQMKKKNPEKDKAYCEKVQFFFKNKARLAILHLFRTWYTAIFPGLLLYVVNFNYFETFIVKQFSELNAP